MRRAFTLLVLVQVAGCARVVVDEGFCLHWSDVDASPSASAVPEGLTCDVFATSPSAGVVPPEAPPLNRAKLEYVCVPDDGSRTCPAPRDAKAEAAACLEDQSGDLCGPDPSKRFGGSCTRHTIWSMCGPDPGAAGGCCYYAYVLESTIVS